MLALFVKYVHVWSLVIAYLTFSSDTNMTNQLAYIKLFDSLLNYDTVPREPGHGL